MKKIPVFLLLPMLLVFSILNIESCSTREDTVSCFPQVAINVSLNLSLPSYYPLQNAGGWVYINEQSSGTRGLIVVRTSNGFKVFDRNAPHLCPETNTTLSVQDNIKIVCPKDNAEWILLTGEPVKVSQIAPKTYPYTYDAASNTLSIYY